MKQKLLLLILSWFVTATTFANTITIQVMDYSFSPSGITVNLGDTIKFVWVNGSHTTTSELIPGSAASWNQPMNSGSVTFTYVPTVAGAYHYECTIHATMGMIDSFFVVNATGVPKLSNPSLFTMYPNPAEKNVHLHFGNANAPVTVTLTDEEGKTILTKQFSGVNDADIDLNGITIGVYMLRAEEGSEYFAQKLEIIR